MATPFRLKRSAIEGKRPAESDLQRGELALNTYDGYLYTEREGVGLSTVTNLTPWYENYGGASIYYSNSVGIGTTVPQYNLDVRKGSIGGYDTLVAQHSDVIKVIAVTVASKTDDHRYNGTGSSNAYLLDGIQAPILTLTPGRTYRFTNDKTGSHPLKFYLEADKTTNYTTGVSFQNTYTEITISDQTPNVLHYQCTVHGYMGNAIVTNSNVVNSNYAATLRGGLDVTSGNVDITQNLNVTGNLDVDGDTTLDITTIDGLLDINAGGQANTFKVEDLTSGRVVIAGTSGELEDSGNLLFNGTDLSASSLIVSDLTSGRVVLAGGSGAVEDNANLKFNTTTSEFEVVGHAVLDTVVASGIVTASSFRGDGSQLTGITTAFGNSSVNSTGIATFSKLSTGANEVGINITTDTITGPKEITIDPAGVGVNTGSVRIKGDLYVDGSTISVSTGDIEFGDFVVGIASTAFTNALLDGAGIGIGSVGIRKFIRYENSSDALKSSEHFDLASGKRYKINGTGVISANGLGAGVVNSALEQLGTLNDLNVSGVSTFSNDATFHTANTNGMFFVKASNKLLFGDNVKATFGASDDLQLYHSGSNSNVYHTGTGNLNILSSTGDIVLVVGGSNEVMLRAKPNAQTELYYNNNLKLETNNTGVVVTGIVSATTFSGTATLATDLAINGTNQLLYQASNNDSAILPTGNAGQILQSNGAGSAPQWVTSAPAGAIEGITVRDESSVVGSANSISTINFIGNGVVADAAVAAGIATVTINKGIAVFENTGTKATGATELDFTGPVISVDAVSNTGIATVRVEGLSVKDEGSTVGTAGSITTLNFVGAGIVAAVSGDTATVTSSGATSDDVVALAIALG